MFIAVVKNSAAEVHWTEIVQYSFFFSESIEIKLNWNCALLESNLIQIQFSMKE